MKHVVGILGAVVFSVIAALLLLHVFNIETDWLFYIIIGIAGYTGLCITEMIYSKVKKKK
jgi:uncharacterized membrane protein YeaQ/YmgE (transglycosylase-associated protein family)